VNDNIPRRAVLACALVLSLTPGPVAGQYARAWGPYQVVTLDHLVLHDYARDRDIPLKIYYPAGRGPFPVIVFSHGALASKDGYSGLGEYWASFGYVSIHPSHADSIADSGYRGTLRQAIDDPVAWQNRPRDISFILDSLSHVDRFAPDLVGKLDLHHVGVGGHSFGAYTASLLGGVTIHVPGRERPLAFLDRRVSAVVLLSPQGEGRLGLTSDSWDGLRLPMLLMYGSRDYGPFGEPPAWRNEAFVKAPPGDKYDVELEGATHMEFAGLAVIGAEPDRLFECVRYETLAFWDAYLKKDPGARALLVSKEIEEASGDAARIATK
jgi:predicted dienelactone hydrolase